MVSIRHCSLGVALSLAVAAPANAGWWSGDAGSTPPAATSVAASAKAAPSSKRASTVPEPADFALFAAGVIGLLLGRRGSRSRPD